MNAVKYHTKYTLSELTDIQREIMESPDNANPDKRSIFLYNKSAQKKLDAISMAITWKLQELRNEKKHELVSSN